MHICRRRFQVRMFTQNSTTPKRTCLSKVKNMSSIQMFMIYSHLIFNLLEYCHPKTCSNPMERGLRGSTVRNRTTSLPEVLKSALQCSKNDQLLCLRLTVVWHKWKFRTSDENSTIEVSPKIMTGVKFWSMSTQQKQLEQVAKLLCVFFWDPPWNPTRLIHLQRARPIPRVHCKCGVIVLHSNYLHCSVVKPRRTCPPAWDR